MAPLRWLRTRGSAGSSALTPAPCGLLTLETARSVRRSCRGGGRCTVQGGKAQALSASATCRSRRIRSKQAASLASTREPGRRQALAGGEARRRKSLVAGEEPPFSSPYRPRRRWGLENGGLVLSLAKASSSSRHASSSSALEESQGSNAAPGTLRVRDYALLDTSREARTGFPEAVWGPGKTPQQIASILSAMTQRQRVAMATRIDADVAQQVQDLLPGVVYHSLARILTFSLQDSNDMAHAAANQLSDDGAPSSSPASPPPSPSPSPSPPSSSKRTTAPSSLFIVSAGTSDLAVAEEARVTASVMMGESCEVCMVTDVGVAGLHRILSQIDTIRQADVVIVVAGMDGALPSVVAGLVDAPVIAVPTSIGYGAALGGLGPLLTMLSSCSPGLTVVNVDNGFGAAIAAGRILRRLQ